MGVGVEPSNEDLLAAVPGDLAAFEVFYRRYVDRVIRFLARRCQNPEDVADATAATFLAVLHSLSTFNPERGTAEGWLFTIAGNEARRLGRSKRGDDALPPAGPRVTVG
jgi:RNA polymerase sigma-70 factor (ECF subfamily)